MRKVNEALKKGSEELAQSWRLRREEQRRMRAEATRQLGEKPVSRTGEADDLASGDSPASTSDRSLNSKTGLTGELNWRDANGNVAGASAESFP